MLVSSEKDMWFMTKDCDIVMMKSVTKSGNDRFYINGCSLKHKQDFFKTPFKSSNLNIYASSGETTTPKLCTYMQ